MALNLPRELAALRRMTVGELRARYAQVCGEETRSRHKGHLIRRIAWKLQAAEEGDISERARRRAKELAQGADVRLTAPRREAASIPGQAKVGALHVAQDARLPMPGTILVREYKGETIEVRVLPEGFEYQGQVYKSLSAVAKAVTGTHWNGYHFFRLDRKGKGNGKGQD